jgi:hypothetical protein
MIAIAGAKPHTADVAVSNYTSSRKTQDPCKAILTAQELASIVPLHSGTILRWAREGASPTAVSVPGRSSSSYRRSMHGLHWVRACILNLLLVPPNQKKED